MKKTTILLTAMFVLILAGSAAAALAVEGSAVPLPTPERALNGEQVNQLLDDLQNGLSNHIEDDISIGAISAKWDAHTNLAGKTRSQILPLLMADVKAIVSDKDTCDAIWESWNGDGGEPAAAPAPEKDNTTGGGWVKLVHEGLYLANFDATWDEAGRPGQKFHSDGRTKGYQQTLTFAPSARNIRLNITMVSPLPAQPATEIANRQLTADDMNKCLIIDGTVAGAKMKVETCDTLADNGKSAAVIQDSATWVRLSQEGAFIAHYSVMWNEPGRPIQTFRSDGIVGFNKKLIFPAGATNIHVEITNDTGMSWQPTREIINRSLSSAELNKCLIVEGSVSESLVRIEACDPAAK